MKDVLLPVGSIVKAFPPRSEKEEEWLIIGRRCVNPESMTAWDYVAVSRENGFKWFFKNEKSFTPDFFYFNHPDIEGIVFEQQEYVGENE
ncbi:DUF4176 domain-containing protein (plasmid) [Brevibacillus halotolerans]|nr:DUF4176 domain-containing protein [Brevibacillus halotolerans]